MKKSVLITGAHGFIGRNVAQLYARNGWAVSGMGHGAWNEQEWKQWGIGKWHAGAITLESLLTHAGTPDVIVHCAGGSSVGHSITNPYLDFQRTVDTVMAVLEFARTHVPGTRIVYPSSGGVYGAALQVPIKESAALQPVSPYGTHKQIAEELCRAYARNFGVASVVVRLFSVYGEGLRKQLMWDACQKIRRGEREFFGTGSEMRDWLHVSDAAELLLAAAEHASPACPVVNGGTGCGVTVHDVLAVLFSQLDRNALPAFTGVARSGDPFAYVADISSAGEWGWHPQVSWQEGVRRYAAWYASVTS